MIHQSCLKIGSILLVVALWCDAAAVMPSMNFDCLKSSDCGPGSCCVMGMMRYSIPTCQKMAHIGEQCRMYDEPMNMTAHYPNDLQLELTDIHRIMCPCDGLFGLSCSQGVCQKGSDNHDLFTNDIDHYTNF